MDERIKAVIDADFFRKLTEYEKGTGLFLRMMDDLGMEPIMHEFVADIELNGNTYLQELLDAGKIQVIHYEDYLREEDYKEYEEYFYAAYEKINYFDFPKGNDIYQYADCGESPGEIRSLYMARKMGYLYFMSDDADARMLVRNFFSNKRILEVKTLFDAFIMCKEKGTELKWKDINPTVTNAMRKRNEKLMKLKEMYADV